MKKREENANLSCSFCGKSQKEVKKLIAGPTVYICDECIELCNDIIAEEYGQEEAGTPRPRVLKPKEINDPEVSKPDDWVDETMIDDPEDKKPEGRASC